jgi:hypothetical protein
MKTQVTNNLKVSMCNIFCIVLTFLFL